MADPGVGAEVVSLDAVPEPPKTTHSINYCVTDPVPVARSLNVVEVAKDKNISVNVQVHVSNTCQKAVAKERCKTSVRNKERNKICEKRFFC